MWQTRFILNVDGWATACEHALLADTALRRMRGLLGRDSLAPGEGMMLPSEWAVHTAFMRFPIDVVFLDREWRVLGIVHAMRPWRAASNRKARAVLELAAGEASARGVKVGDQLLVLEGDPSEVEHDRSDGAARRAPTAADPDEPAPPRDPAILQRSRRTQGTSAPTAILLVSCDRRFRTVVSALLERRGCKVSVAGSLGRVPQAIAGNFPDVVVLDAARSSSSPASTVAALRALVPEAGLVIVAEEPLLTAGFAMHPKWGVFDELVGAIEDARCSHSGAMIN